MMIEFKFMYIPEHEEVIKQYPEANDLESWIITFHNAGFDYGEMQLVLGNPSKKIIKNTIKKFIK